jgi:hypothetical protein
MIGYQIRYVSGLNRIQLFGNGCPYLAKASQRRPSLLIRWSASALFAILLSVKWKLSSWPVRNLRINSFPLRNIIVVAFKTYMAESQQLHRCQ